MLYIPCGTYSQMRVLESGPSSRGSVVPLDCAPMRNQTKHKQRKQNFWGRFALCYPRQGRPKHADTLVTNQQHNPFRKARSYQPQDQHQRHKSQARRTETHRDNRDRRTTQPLSNEITVSVSRRTTIAVGATALTINHVR